MTERSETKLGTRIRQARKDAGFRNAETLAVAMGVSHRTVQRWEANEGEPSIARMREIAVLTGKPLEYFFSSNGASA